MSFLTSRLVLCHCNKPVLSRRQSASFAPDCLRYISCGARLRHPRETLVVDVMGPKRKKSEMALMREDLTTLEHHSPEGRVDSPTRRSKRQLSRSGVGLYPDANAASEAKSVSRNTRSKVQQEKIKGLHGVEVVMNGLQEMEDNLRDAVKRQKLAVKSTSFMSDASGEAMESFTENPTLLPRPTKSENTVCSTRKRTRTHQGDPEQQSVFGGDLMQVDAEAEMEAGSDDTNAMRQEGRRPPPVNSDYLPLPWKGRLGYACLNTYLRTSNPPVFSSRTCRIASILEHRHPLQDPSLPEHPTKNRPDKTKPADVTKGQKYVESLGLANAKDIVKMLRWNHKHGIKFMRLSSEMFPFASHDEYGYKLAPFASEVLAEAGKLAAELGHRLTTHPGQLGSPRPEVVRNAVRDLEYHHELLSLLRLPEQLDKDAVMILHMGGVFGDKKLTLERFRQNYAKLSPGIKARLVLENDDVSWSVHDLLPVCEELKIPLVLDFHHHNIIFDKDQLREGTKDIMELFPRIKATWDKKGIKQKMHYSEPCAEAITPRQRRKHSPRVISLPPCPNDMDLMIEAKDKEQAVFTLMRTYKLPGWELINDVVPYERDDENRPPPKTPKKKKARGKRKCEEEAEEEQESEMDLNETPHKYSQTPDELIGMGGPLNRVFWPVGMEEWLRPKKRESRRGNKNENGEKT